MSLQLNRITVATLLVSFWFVFYILTFIVGIDQRTNNADPLVERLSEALHMVEELKEQNKKLVQTNFDLNKDGKSTSAQECQCPLLAHQSRQHEDLRRSVTNGLKELWYSISSKLNKSEEKSKDAIFESLAEQHRSVLTDALQLSQVDNADEYRRNQLQNLSKIIQNRIDFLQNPKDCSITPKLLCQLNKECGFGCQMHHAAYCLIVAYSTNRSLILNTTGWQYSNKGWDSVFQPVSKSCSISDAENSSGWIWNLAGFEKQHDIKVVSLPIIDELNPRLHQLPQSFPKDLADELLLLHSNPPVWWIGQFVWYLMRYQPFLHADFEEKGRKSRFNKGPIVGVHVRRTDKVGKEAELHFIEEYMTFVEDWYQLQRIRTDSLSIQKRIYLATDQPSLIHETKLKYPDYEILADPLHSESAQLYSRYSDSSLHSIIEDIHFLSRCDYLVCTFSSQICRLAYELMQMVNGGDAADNFKSLDDIYYFGGQHDHEQIAILNHFSEDSNEIDLRVGDTIVFFGNHWNGYSKGRNTRTGLTGVYPSYKAKEKWRVVDFH